ncbi:MAG: AAA family ATPase [Patescibacteria group bacterium]
MLNKIQIQNFQIHENVELSFCPGINLIVGVSEHGKSAIFRALYWLIENKPDGSEYCSFWNRDLKGNIVKDISVSSWWDNGVLAHKRDSKVNGYVLNDQEFTALNRAVPDEVLRMLNLNEVNVQKQDDRQYLLFETEGEVARVFNKMVRLDTIDLVLSSVKSKARKASSELKVFEEEQVRLVEELVQYKNLDAVVSLIDSTQILETSNQEDEKQKTVLNGLLSEYEVNEKIIDGLGFIEEVDDLISQFETLNSENLVDRQRELQLSDDLKEYENNVKVIDVWEQVKEVEALIKEAEDIQTDINDISKRQVGLSNDLEYFRTQRRIKKELLFVNEIEVDILNLEKEYQELDRDMNKRKVLMSMMVEYKNSVVEIKDFEAEYLELELTLPDICPLCGLKKEEV